MNPEEREWQAQEAAARCDRNGGDGHELDALGASYLSVVRAARQPIAVPLPADFASRVAALAAERPSAAGLDSRFERRLLQILAAILCVAAVAAALVYGGNWLVATETLASQLDRPSLSLLLSLLGCLGVSALSQQLRGLFAGFGHSDT
ncbi:MAG TPA: hypothetical protein VFN25_02465 [Dokdonella sp.]|uniref:hypothetical protein n=1 Tax=Dokdonella sp. TaxID=2291710 RepID=UPI002D7E611A|nr:hypothetical protein [Dokdonella sp.]HET9031748.1 hypothetical protein [Dokdonella sp.]